MSATQGITVPSEKLADYRGHDFYPSVEQWAQVPELYGTEHVPTEDTVVHLHYSLFDCDWWVTEVDHVTGLAVGYECLHDDHDMAECGYIDLTELEALFQQALLECRESTGTLWLRPRLIVERDLSWTPRPFSELDINC